jgi:hypothetical protein
MYEPQTASGGARGGGGGPTKTMTGFGGGDYDPFGAYHSPRGMNNPMGEYSRPHTDRTAMYGNPNMGQMPSHRRNEVPSRDSYMDALRGRGARTQFYNPTQPQQDNLWDVRK